MRRTTPSKPSPRAKHRPPRRQVGRSWGVSRPWGTQSGRRRGSRTGQPHRHRASRALSSKPSRRCTGPRQLRGTSVWHKQVSSGGGIEGAVSSEQTAAPATPSTFTAFSPPATPVEATSPPPAHLRSSTRTLKPSSTARGLQSGDGVAHSGGHASRPASRLQAPSPFAEDPDEAEWHQ